MKHRTFCALCGGEDRLRTVFTETVDPVQPWIDFLDIRLFPLTVRGMLCKRCGWIFKSEVYDEEELSRLYREAGGEASDRGTSGTRPETEYRGKQIYDFVSSYLSEGKQRILDVGGRGGELMGTFVKAGHDVTALDMARDRKGAYGTVRLVEGSFLAWIQDSYNVIIMSHVLEHTDDPTIFLKHAYSRLHPGGLVFIEVPFELPTPLIRRHIGDHRHLGYFSSMTLRGFLERAGFEVLRCTHLVDIVGAPIPLLRAVGRKTDSPNDMWRPGRFAAALSCLEVVRPHVWISRVRNRICRSDV